MPKAFNQSCDSCPAWPKSLFKSLNKDQLAALSLLKVPQENIKNDFLFNQGDPVNGIFCNGDGLLKITQKDSHDKIKFSRLVYPGDSAGHRSIFIAEKYKGSACVVSDKSHTCFISKANLLNLFSSNNEFAKDLISKISTELDRSVSDQIKIKERSVTSRLCSLLVDLFDNFSESTSEKNRALRLTISKVELARLLSVADETVIRIMTELKNESILEFSGKNLILQNYDKLKKFSLP